MDSKLKLFILRWRCFSNQDDLEFFFIKNKASGDLFNLFIEIIQHTKRSQIICLYLYKPLYFNHTVLTYKICKFDKQQKC